MQALLDCGLNGFGAQLLAESLLKSPIAASLNERQEPLRFELPIRREDCPGWIGVEFTLRPIAAQAESADDVVHLKDGTSVDLGARWSMPP